MLDTLTKTDYQHLSREIVRNKKLMNIRLSDSQHWLAEDYEISILCIT